jgi:hypothetical protein
MNLYKILRNRLKQRTNKKFSKWRHEQKKFAGENHHILKSFMGAKKQNDYLQAELTHWKHLELTYKREPTEDEFIDMFIESLEYVFDYIQYLESKK